MHFIYVADPMCSWCYGFGPELRGLLENFPDARLDIVVGGLRAFNTEVMIDAKKASILEHWKHVAEASGLPFTAHGMPQPDFIYDTEPACRTVVAARTLADDLPSAAILDVFLAIQHAFYAEGKDVTNLALLAQIAADALNTAGETDTFDAASFYETLTSPMTMADTRQDFEQTQRWGISGFPTLLLAQNDALHMIASGYTKTANLLASVRQLQQAAMN